MSKGSKLLKGGVIVGLSTATFIAYGGAAVAATTPAGTGAITITPPAGGTTGNTGDCLVYTVSQTGATGGYLDVSVNSTSGHAAFCAPLGTAEAPAGTPPPTATERVTVNGSGSTTFGVTDTSAESVSIQAWDDNVTADDKFTGGEPNNAATATFISNQGDSAVTKLAASPSSVLVRPGDSATYTVTATNGNTAATNQGVSGATINYVVSGPDATVNPVACGTTDSNGVRVCTVPTVNSNTTAGTDTVTFFVNNATNSGPGVDPGDTQTTATMNDVGKSPADDTIVAFCGNTGPSSTTRACTDSIDASNPNINNSVTEPFGFDVLDPVATDVNNSDLGSDVTVDFTMSGASAGATLSKTSDTCHTFPTTILNGEKGCQVTVSVTEPHPTPGEKITVTGTLHGGTATQADSASIAFVAAVSSARNVTLTPVSQSVVVGHEGVLLATVTDAGGHPVPGVSLDFSSSGVGAFISGCVLSSTCVTEQSGAGSLPTTNANGQIEVQVASGTTGNELVGVTIDSSNGSQCADQAGFVNGAPVTGVTAGNCAAAAGVKYVSAPARISERPHLSGHKHGHSVRLTAVTHPNLRHRSVHFYIVRNGVNHLVASRGTGSTGVAHATIRHLKKGHYTFVCRVVKLGSHYVSHFSNRIHKHIT